MLGDADAKPPRELTPAFFGCATGIPQFTALAAGASRRRLSCRAGGGGRVPRSIAA
jgi:hypothetical protein